MLIVTNAEATYARLGVPPTQSSRLQACRMLNRLLDSVPVAAKVYRYRRASRGVASLGGAGPRYHHWWLLNAAGQCALAEAAAAVLADEKPCRNDPHFKGDYNAFHRAVNAWFQRQTKRKRSSSPSSVAVPPACANASEVGGRLPLLCGGGDSFGYSDSERGVDDGNELAKVSTCGVVHLVNRSVSTRNTPSMHHPTWSPASDGSSSHRAAHASLQNPPAALVEASTGSRP